jgi:hypothetical protein
MFLLLNDDLGARDHVAPHGNLAREMLRHLLRRRRDGDRMLAMPAIDA